MHSSNVQHLTDSQAEQKTRIMCVFKLNMDVLKAQPLHTHTLQSASNCH